MVAEQQNKGINNFHDFLHAVQGDDCVALFCSTSQDGLFGSCLDSNLFKGLEGEMIDSETDSVKTMSEIAKTYTEELRRIKATKCDQQKVQTESGKKIIEDLISNRT